MSEILSLLVSTNAYPNAVEPLRGIYIARQIEELARRDQVRVVAPVPFVPPLLRSEPRFSSFVGVPARERVRGVDVWHPRRLVPPKVGRSFYGVLYGASLAGPLWSLGREGFRPQAVLGFWAYPDGFGTVAAARLLGLPVVIGALGCDVNDYPRHPPLGALIRWALRQADLVLAVSQAMGETIVGLGVPRARVRIIPNGVDTSLYHIQEQGLARGRLGLVDEPTVLFVGRLAGEKGMLDDPAQGFEGGLIKAFGYLVQRRPQARLLVVGDGEQRPALEQAVAQAGLGDHVRLLGTLAPEDVALAMAAADVLALPSIREGWPNVVMESLACGLPVVAYRVGGVPEILDRPETGMLVREGDARAMAGALEEALGRPWDRRAVRARVERRGWDAVAGEVREAVIEAMALHGHRKGR